MTNRKPPRSEAEIVAQAQVWVGAWTADPSVERFIQAQLPAIEVLLRQRWSLEAISQAMAAAGVLYSTGTPVSPRVLSTKLYKARRRASGPGTKTKSYEDRLLDRIEARFLQALQVSGHAPRDMRAEIAAIAQRQPANSSPLPRQAEIGDPVQVPVERAGAMPKLQPVTAPDAPKAASPTPTPPARPGPKIYGSRAKGDETPKSLTAVEEADKARQESLREKVRARIRTQT